MIGIADVEGIHNILIEKFGGAKGIRDMAVLESAINRPYQTFDGIELYPNPVDKAAAIFESIISNHPFVDGNKRTAYTLLRLVLMEHHMDINAGQNEKYDFVISAAKSEVKFEGIRKWIADHLVGSKSI